MPSMRAEIKFFCSRGGFFTPGVFERENTFFGGFGPYQKSRTIYRSGTKNGTNEKHTKVVDLFVERHLPKERMILFLW